MSSFFDLTLTSFLYATYIAPSASMDIGLHQSKKNMIYQKIDPAFEDLFDPAEEYILTILLEPWMKMVEADKYTYGKVELVEETRQLDSVYFRKLQALHQESGSKQDELMHSGGGWGQILHDRLPAAVLLEIQQCIQKRLEKQWLPLFLADEHHGAEGQAKIRDINEDLPHQKQEKTTRMWKASEVYCVSCVCSFTVFSVWTLHILHKFPADSHVDNKWVSPSSEIIAFRKALLNPVTANQFQRFVSLKGDLLENGVLFWQEVQKYKDLCHSHCDDATVQKKITAIIDCFINSAVPPALQIDIPIEQAKKILEHRRELGPYIFREAQMTIFALLFKFWPKFCFLVLFQVHRSLGAGENTPENARRSGEKLIIIPYRYLVYILPEAWKLKKIHHFSKEYCDFGETVKSSQETESEYQCANKCALKFGFLKASFPAISADAH
ncbi:regulator of G-protein signaling 22 [Grus japonensis]|uniref:Regulator of G-protein signaling 22 n=1 Tax=Grus japonensis TaxID=30415 RepID=A0ABC9W8R3_GRUJA